MPSLAQGKLAATARLDCQLHGTPRPARRDGRAAATRAVRAPSAACACAGVSGLISGRVRLGGSGETLRELAAAANGTVAAVMPNGEVQATLVQSASLELSGLLGRLRASPQGNRHPLRGGKA